MTMELPIQHETITPPSNLHLTESVESRLREDPHLNEAEIQVSADEGTVTLKGKVINAATRLRAETVVGDVPGVFEVINQIGISR